MDVQGPRPPRPSTAGHGRDTGRRAGAAPTECAGRARGGPRGGTGEERPRAGRAPPTRGPPTWGWASVRAVLLLLGPFAVPRAGALEREQQGRLAPGKSTELSPASSPRRLQPVPCAPALTWAPGGHPNEQLPSGRKRALSAQPGHRLRAPAPRSSDGRKRLPGETFPSVTGSVSSAEGPPQTGHSLGYLCAASSC